MGVHMPTLPDADLGIQKGGGVAPIHGRMPRSGAAAPGPCRNCKTASHIRKHWRAHRNGV